VRGVSNVWKNLSVEEASLPLAPHRSEEGQRQRCRFYSSAHSAPLRGIFAPPRFPICGNLRTLAKRADKTRFKRMKALVDADKFLVDG